MLAWDQSRTIAGHTAYPHEDNPLKWSVLPKGPRFRVGPDGNPVFLFLQYRDVLDRGDGKKAGGYLVCDVVFAVPDGDLEAVRAVLQAEVDAAHGDATTAPKVQLGPPLYTKGTTTITLLDSDGSLVEEIRAPAAPSAYGEMVTPITAELSARGSTLLEEALSGNGAVLQVTYDMVSPVRMPDMTATISFEAGKFMEFHQQVDIDWSFWGEDEYRESVSEQFRSSESGHVEVDPGSVTDPKVVAAVTDWAWESLDDAVARMVIGDIAAVPEADREVPDGMENVWRDVSVGKVASFSRTFRQGVAYDQPVVLTGSVPNITTLKDADGNPLRWADFAHEVDLNDPFLQTLRVTARANADFADLPIDSVEVKIRYADKPVREFAFLDADDIAKYEQYMDGAGSTYAYSYQVNYQGESRRYESPEVTTDEEILTINVGDTGVLDIDVLAGDLNFAQIAKAQVLVRYEDAAGGVEPLEHSLMLDADHRSGRVQQVVFAPVVGPYQSRTTLTMSDGKEYSTDWQYGRSRQLYINDPFAAVRKVGVRAFGNFESRIETIFLELAYQHPSGYTQTTSVALNKGKPFADWHFPVLDELGGDITYSGTVTFKDGSSPEPIPEQVTTKNTIMVGDVPRDIVVMADLVDFSAVKLVKLSLRYVDSPGRINEARDIVFKAGSPTTLTWSHSFKEGDPEYTWQVQYFRVGGGSTTLGPATSSELTFLVPEVPS